MAIFFPQVEDSGYPSKKRIIPKKSTLDHTTPNAHPETALNNRNFIVYHFNDLGYFEELVLDPKVKSKDLLDNDRILLFIDPKQFKEWLWVGCNTTPRAKSIADKMALPIREKYGTNLPRGLIPYIATIGFSLS